MVEEEALTLNLSLDLSQPGYEDWLVLRFQGRGTVMVAGEEEIELLEMEVGLLPREVWILNPILDLCLWSGYEDWLEHRLQVRGTVKVAVAGEEAIK